MAALSGIKDAVDVTNSYGIPTTASTGNRPTSSTSPSASKIFLPLTEVITSPDITRSAVWPGLTYDLDDDGFQDLVVVNGFVARSNGSNTVWINGVDTRHGDLSAVGVSGPTVETGAEHARLDAAFHCAGVDSKDRPCCARKLVEQAAGAT